MSEPPPTPSRPANDAAPASGAPPTPARPDARATLPSRRWIAAILLDLLLPGCGHAAAGRTRRGLAWLALHLALGALAPLSRWLLYGFVFGLLALRVAVVWDLFRCGRRVARVPSAGRATAVVLGFVVAAVAANAITRQYVGEAFRLPSASMAPTLAGGDHVMVVKLGASSDGPAAGQVIVFEHPQRPGTMFLKRVIARAGQRVEVRCGVVYVDGAALPQELIDGPDTCHYWDERMDGGSESTWEQVACSRYRETLGERRYQLYYDPDRAQPDNDGRDPSRRRGDFPVDAATPFPHLAAAAGSVEPSGDGGGDACASRLAYVVPDGHVFVLGDHRDNSSDSRHWGPVRHDAVQGRAGYVWWSNGPGGEVRWGRVGHVIE